MNYRWQTTLANLVDYPQFHARFLNTLSLLEYIGARKIMKSQDEKNISPAVLGHMVEEIRHAQIVKKIAMKVGGSGVKTYAEENLVRGREARDYIQAIDHAAQEALGEKDGWINYLLTTLIVEERAHELYPFYDSLLAPLGLSGPFKTIFREEEEHLAQVTELLKKHLPNAEGVIARVRAVEQEHFEKFFRAVEDEFRIYRGQQAGREWNASVTM